MPAGLARLIRQDKVPVVLTLLFSAIGWTAIRSIDQITAVPFIEYRVSEERSSGSRTLNVRLRNVTYTQQFACTKVIVVPYPRDRLTFDVKAYSVRLESNQVPGVAPTPGPKQMAFQIDRFGPKSDILLRMPVTGDAEIRLLSAACEGPVAGSEDDEAAGKRKPLLIERSLRTFLVEWELQVLWGLIFVWAAVVLPFGMSRPQAAHGPTGSNVREPEGGGIDE